MYVSDLNNLSGYEFEDIVEQLIQKMGFITAERSRGADGGIDILAINEQPLFQGKYVIQCKRYSGNVGVAYVRDLYGVVHSKNANKGILITNSDFTAQSIRFSEDKQIELINGDRLLSLLNQYELGTISTTSKNVPSGLSTFMYYFGKPFNSFYLGFLNIEAGLTSINKKFVNPLPIENYWKNSYLVYEDNKKSIINLCNQLNTFILSDESINTDRIGSLSKLFMNSVDNLFKTYKKGLSLIPTHEHYKPVYGYFLDVFSNAFHEIKLTIDRMNDYIYSNENHEKPRLWITFETSESSLDLFLSNGSTAYLFRDLRKSRIKKTGCFIVTATYGSPYMAKVEPFRIFRDKALMSNRLGRLLVDSYYLVSPSIAVKIRNSYVLKTIIRTFIIDPIHTLLTLARNQPLVL